jgi:hypothetical protein
VLNQIRVVTDNLWKLLCSLHPPEQEFTRMALDEENIEYYPKKVYYIEADAKGNYILGSQTVKFLSCSRPVHTLLNLDGLKVSEDKIGVFTKDF